MDGVVPADSEVSTTVLIWQGKGSQVYSTTFTILQDLNVAYVVIHNHWDCAISWTNI